MAIAYFILLTACSNVKYLAENEILHNSTRISIESKDKIEDKSLLKQNLYLLSKPLPNTRMFGLFKWKLTIHNETKDATKGLRKWLNEALGEQPVLVNNVLLNRSTESMKKYLKNKGYFGNEVTCNTNINAKRATVDYTITLPKPYRLDSIFFPVDTTSQVIQLINELQSESLLKSGQQFDAELLQKEMGRITYDLRNTGYYDFNSKFLHFNLDSAKNNRTIDVFLTVDTPKDTTNHLVYRIGEVYIHPQYSPKRDKSFYNDTLLIDNAHYITPSKKRLRPNVITKYALIRRGELYAQRNHEYMINHLLDLGVFKFVNIQYKRVQRNGQYLLDCYIYLTPNKKMEISFETQLNNRSSSSAVTKSLLGASLNIGYKNKNLFKGAEAFTFNINTGVEFDPSSQTPLINTLDLSGEITLRFPKFVSPFKIKGFSQYYRPKTKLSLGVDYIQRVGFYTLNSYNLGWGYDWRGNANWRHIYQPVSVNLVGLLSQTADFTRQLAENPLLAQSFQERVILGSNYTYIFNNQSLNKAHDFIYFRGNVEFSGNLMFLLDKTLQVTGTINESLTILGNKYAQYARLETDFRYYKILNRRSSFVSRFAFGIGLPYGNSKVLPYIKQFFVGGTNSLRAFPIRGIGPGSFGTALSPDEEVNEFDRTGDIKLEFNFEYRFDLVSYLKGAVFADIGNVWTLNDLSGTAMGEMSPRPGGKFEFRDFWEELGMGLGMGLRIDFSYFIIRFDLATPIYNPSLAKGQRWLFKPFAGGNTQLNLAIGYPF